MPEAGLLFDRMLQEFSHRQLEAPEIEAAALMAELRGCNRVQARLERHAVLNDETFQRGLEILVARLAGQPWQYIFHRAYFRDLTLYVDNRVLIPRPETELLVDWVLAQLPEHGKLLDLGTGSGAIALAIATERPDAEVYAVDASSDALQVAMQNGEAVAPGRVIWQQSDLFQKLAGKRFDVIAANLPYVTEEEYRTLSTEVRDWEPKMALTSGDDGLDLIRRTIAQAGNYLNAYGAIILELAPAQARPVAKLLAENLSNHAIEILKDYTQRDRFVAARRRKPVIF